jgi:hypothetical protein
MREPECDAKADLRFGSVLVIELIAEPCITAPEAAETTESTASNRTAS